MMMGWKRLWRSRRNQVIFSTIIIIGVVYYFVANQEERENNLDITRRYIEGRIQDALKEEKGSGCTIPKLDPFSKEVMQFDKEMPPVVCTGIDWVRCYLQSCKVVDEILATVKYIKCYYRDIIYVHDDKYTYGEERVVLNKLSYQLMESDHVHVRCTGINITTGHPNEWSGFAIGFRDVVQTIKNDNDTMNILMLGFDSTSHNGFIRRMPKSYKVLTQVLGATVLNGYNIVGDGTPAALFPILTGQTELELPDVRKKAFRKLYLDDIPFIFRNAKKHGYRTAYFEDMPNIGTFQLRFNGFRQQPADHYLRSFFMALTASGEPLKLLGQKVKKIISKTKKNKENYCVGSRPSYELMLDITKQFMDLNGKKFCFNFIADITHDDFNMISTADDYFSKYLVKLLEKGYLDDTLLVVMGDHGPRYAKVRGTLQGKQEERLPLMALRLPARVAKSKPKYLANLNANAQILTTPFDIHPTFLYSMGIPQYRNPYSIPGVEIARSMSLFHEIPANRSCSEAGIEPHWCACLHWKKVDQRRRVYKIAARTLLDHLNELTQEVRNKCALRTLTSIDWVMHQIVNRQLLEFKNAKDVDGYLGSFVDNTRINKEYYEVKISVGPGNGVYEASMAYHISDDKFTINTTDISRINAYGTEPHCISDTRPDLNMFCYCKD